MTVFPRPPAAAPDRRCVLGKHLQMTVLTAPEDTDGRHDLADVTLPPGSAAAPQLPSPADEGFRCRRTSNVGQSVR
ncbi:hypothetical protein [Nocardia sp. NPDC057272]|uniref:hypothetical protein n=1 Tax=Nocardia sp. NPDC057272 TaxID=3346079 RepID=UPI00363182C7